MRKKSLLDKTRTYPVRRPEFDCIHSETANFKSPTTILLSNPTSLTLGKSLISYCSWWMVLSVLKWYVSINVIHSLQIWSSKSLFDDTGNLWISQHFPITRFPKVIGILTHVDFIKKSPTLEASKKNLTNRFWTETLPSTVTTQTEKPWNSVLSSSETLIHTSSLIESKIALLENFQKEANCNCIVTVRETNLR